MKKYVLGLILLVSLTALRTKEEFFTGKILYKFSFADLKGNDLNNKLVPYLGSEQHYFIDAKNYKSYNQNKLQQLYNAETNTYYFFTGAKSAQRIKGDNVTSQKFIVKNLKTVEKVAGYDCKAVQIETDDATTIYFYSPEIKTDRKVFSNHSFGEWNRFLEATDGALALKYIMTNKKQGFVWTSTAVEISPMKLLSKDFLLPDDVQVKY